MLLLPLYRDIICGLIYSYQKVRFQYIFAFNYSGGFQTVLSVFTFALKLCFLYFSEVGCLVLFTRQAEKNPIIPYYFLELCVTSHFCSLQHFSKLKKNTEKLVIFQVTEKTLIWLLEVRTPAPNMASYIFDKSVL